MLPASFGEKKLSRRLQQQYCRPFSSSSERHGAVGFARSLANEGDWLNGVGNQLHKIDHLPTLLVWGMRDRFITPAHLEKLRNMMRGAAVKTIATAGHFPHEEEPGAVMEWIASFCNNNRI